MKEKSTILRNIFFVLLSAGIVFTSCNKDDENKNDLIGTWTFSTATFDAKVGNKPLNQYFIEDMGLSSSDAQLAVSLFNAQLQQNFSGTVVFRSDNTYTSTMGGQSETGTWTLSSGGNQLTLDPATGDATVLDVVTLTSDLLKVHFADTGNDDLNGDNVPETIAVDVNMTFTKQ